MSETLQIDELEKGEKYMATSDFTGEDMEVWAEGNGEGGIMLRGANGESVTDIVSDVREIEDEEDDEDNEEDVEDDEDENEISEEAVEETKKLTSGSKIRRYNPQPTGKAEVVGASVGGEDYESYEEADEYDELLVVKVEHGEYVSEVMGHSRYDEYDVPVVIFEDEDGAEIRREASTVARWIDAGRYERIEI